MGVYNNNIITHVAFHFVVNLLCVSQVILSDLELKLGLLQVPQFPVFLSQLPTVRVMEVLLLQVNMSQVQVQGGSGQKTKTKISDAEYYSHTYTFFKSKV